MRIGWRRCSPSNRVDTAMAEHDRAERRRRLLPDRLVVYCVLAPCPFARESYEELLRVLTSGVPGSRGLARVNRSSLCRARAKLGEEVLESVFRQVAEPFATPATQPSCVCGSVAVFCSRLDAVRVTDPREIRLVADDSPNHRRGRLFLDAVMRRTFLPQTEHGRALADGFRMDRQVRLLRPDVVGLSKAQPVAGSGPLRPGRRHGVARARAARLPAGAARSWSCHSARRGGGPAPT
ncbi:transposase domain-containing protein [Streptomyces sp. NPDC090445]|uniref:transposase domain-containing protein n=1 Tax=Streptomyces sp. NPDC090445 TaxID=3365963 RepID=UPI00380FE85C